MLSLIEIEETATGSAEVDPVVLFFSWGRVVVTEEFSDLAVVIPFLVLAVSFSAKGVTKLPVFLESPEVSETFTDSDSGDKAGIIAELFTTAFSELEVVFSLVFLFELSKVLSFIFFIELLFREISFVTSLVATALAASV